MALKKFLFEKHSFGVAIFLSIFIFVFASFGLVVANGESVEPTDLHIVSLSIDGQTEFVPTRANTVGEFLSKQKVSLSGSDIVTPSQEATIGYDNYKVEVLRAEPTTIIEGGKITTLLSPYKDPREAVEKAGIELFREDNVDQEYSGDPSVTQILGRKLVVKRATLVYVSIYGTIVEHRTNKTSVGDVFKEMGVVPEHEDVISPDLSTPITSKQLMAISRVGYQFMSVEEDIPFDFETYEDSSLSKGSTKIVREGINGKKLVSYEVTIENGVESARRAIQETTVSKPVNQRAAVGAKPLFEDYNADGIPARVFCGTPHQNNWKNINVGNAAAGRTLAAERGWTGSEFDALLELFACESSWNELAGNPYSGAYGIPQSLPANKMASFGADYLTNPITQLRWGLNYIAARYGTPSEALAFHYRNNYY